MANICFKEEVYTVLEDDGSITICMEFSPSVPLDMAEPITVLVKTKDISAEGIYGLGESVTSVTSS